MDSFDLQFAFGNSFIDDPGAEPGQPGYVDKRIPGAVWENGQGSEDGSGQGGVGSAMRDIGRGALANGFGWLEADSSEIIDIFADNVDQEANGIFGNLTAWFVSIQDASYRRGNHEYIRLQDVEIVGHIAAPNSSHDRSGVGNLALTDLPAARPAGTLGADDGQVITQDAPDLDINASASTIDKFFAATGADYVVFGAGLDVIPLPGVAIAYFTEVIRDRYGRWYWTPVGVEGGAGSPVSFYATAGFILSGDHSPDAVARFLTGPGVFATMSVAGPVMVTGTGQGDFWNGPGAAEVGLGTQGYTIGAAYTDTPRGIAEKMLIASSWWALPLVAYHLDTADSYENLGIPTPEPRLDYDENGGGYGGGEYDSGYDGGGDSRVYEP